LPEVKLAFELTFILPTKAIATRSTTGRYFATSINKLATIQIKVDFIFKAAANTFHQNIPFPSDYHSKAELKRASKKNRILTVTLTNKFFY
jgi:hypothetical protein